MDLTIAHWHIRIHIHIRRAPAAAPRGPLPPTPPARSVARGARLAAVGRQHAQQREQAYLWFRLQGGH